MATFNLKIFSPYGVHFEGEAEAITLRTVTGDVSIWPNHSNTVTALDVGRCTVVIGGEKRVGVCNRGLLNVTKNDVQDRLYFNQLKENLTENRGCGNCLYKQKSEGHLKHIE